MYCKILPPPPRLRCLPGPSAYSGKFCGDRLGFFQVISSPDENILTVWPLKRQLDAAGGSRRKNSPRLVSVSGNKIICSPEDNDCLAMNQQGFCSHTIATAITKDVLDTYVLSIRRKEETLSQIATKNLSPNVGKKKKGDTRKRRRSRSRVQQLPQQQQQQQLPQQLLPLQQQQQPQQPQEQPQQPLPLPLPLPQPQQQQQQRPPRGRRESIPIHRSQGDRRGPKPAPASSVSGNDSYKLLKRTGKVTLCVGCWATNLKETERYVLQRKEQVWYPHSNDDGSESWRLSAKKNVYYHPSLCCVTSRNINFMSSLIDSSGVHIDEEVNDLLNNLGVD